MVKALGIVEKCQIRVCACRLLQRVMVHKPFDWIDQPSNLMNIHVAIFILRTAMHFAHEHHLDLINLMNTSMQNTICKISI